MGRAPIFIFISLICLVSCDKNRVSDQYQSLPGQWHKDSLVTFEVEAPDTVNPYNLFINIRNNANYKYSNLYLITEIYFPHGKVISDTLQYEMAKPNGEWLGTGFGEIKENKLWYKENFTFPESGNYSVRLQQAMRKRDSITGIESLKGITEVGLRIENSIN